MISVISEGILAVANASEEVTLSQQEQISPPPASQAPPANQAPSAPAVSLPKPPPASSGFWSRFTIPLFAVLAAFAFIALGDAAMGRMDRQRGRSRPPTMLIFAPN